MRRRTLGRVGPDSLEKVLPDDALVGKIVTQFADLLHVKRTHARGGQDGRRTRRKERMSSISR